MSNDNMVLVLAIVGVILSIIELANTRGRSAISWGLLVVAIAVVLIAHPLLT